MASDGKNFNYFPQNQLNKFSAHSWSIKSKQQRQNKCKSGGTNNLQGKRAEIFLTVVYGEFSH